MSFYIDKQSLDDLNVFGKRGRDSVYGMFNVARTRGGGQVLEGMFRYPLNDTAAINRRSSIIRYFMNIGMEFPFRGELFDTVEYYLGNTDQRTKISAHDNTLQRKLMGVVGADTEYEQLYKGVMASIEVLCTLRDFTARMGLRPEVCAESPQTTPLCGLEEEAAGVNRISVDAAGSPNPYREELEELAELVADPDFAPLLAECGSKRLGYAKTAALDELVRFKLREKLQRILQRIYYLDVYVAVAAVAKRRNFAFARALPGDDNMMNIEGMYHPQVKDAVPNTLRVTPEGNVIFLTGANMAGKSTLMKTLGLTVYLAHVGFPVPARSMEFATLDGMFTTINLPDNLSTGYSHFYAEVMRVKKVAEALGKSKRLLVIFDELFRGTNVKDAFDATVAITQAFAGKRDCLFVISTHIIEAGDTLRDLCGNVRFVYLPTIMEGSVARYPYTLREGITSDRHGMMIINNENVVDIIKQGGRVPDHPASPTFTVDQQTLEDLNLLGEYRPNSVFSIFNKTKTRGGKQLLEEMFRNPLTDAARINERAAAFRYFQDQRRAFPFTSVQVDAVEQYLNAGARSSIAGAYISTARMKAMQLISRDQEYELTSSGLEATVEFLGQLKDFTQMLGKTDLPAAVGPIIGQLESLLSDRRMEWVFSPRKSGVPWYSLVRQDYTLRCKLYDKMQAMMRAVYMLDLYISVSEVAAERKFTYPQAHDYHPGANHIELTGFFHPAIPKAVPNDVSVTCEQNVLFLTGANMAGKSTLMKSFSVAVYLAHMGFPVAAERMEFTVQDGMYTSINVCDNLVMGYSHFYAEVVRVKHVAQQVASGKNLLVVFDELFKGTNVKDAYDATVAVTDAFAGHRNCMYIISTHIIEAGHTLSQTEAGLQFVYMPTVMDGAKPTYSYRLTPGITNDRHGMVIIRNERIVDIINSSR